MYPAFLVHLSLLEPACALKLSRAIQEGPVTVHFTIIIILLMLLLSIPLQMQGQGAIEASLSLVPPTSPCHQQAALLSTALAPSCPPLRSLAPHM